MSFSIDAIELIGGLLMMLCGAIVVSSHSERERTNGLREYRWERRGVFSNMERLGSSGKWC